MKVISISVLMPVSLSVDAFMDEHGDVQIASVRSYIGLPTATEIYEVMDAEDFEGLVRTYEGES